VSLVPPSVCAVSEYRLAEIATAANVTPRTVRYYQATGLLPQPTRRGNHVVYTDAHLSRLQAIAQLQEQGLRLETIRRMLDGHHDDHDNVVALLGPDLVGSAWLAASARTLTEGELADMLGDHYPEMVSDLVTAGYLEIRGERGQPRHWFAPSVPQLKGAVALAEIGTDVALSGAARDVLGRRMRRLAEDLVKTWIAESGRLYSGDATREELLLNLELIRSVAWQSAAHVMAVEIERAIRNADVIRERMGHRPATRLRTPSRRDGGLPAR
jgi:DNA-binding transcriptional MerR regulator